MTAPTTPPVLTAEQLTALRQEQEALARQWRATTTLESMQALREASLNMLVAMLGRTKTPVETPKISSEVVNRVAGYRPYRPQDMERW